ncbi:hypothetical protein GV829_04555 [Sphingomonas lacunae]|uniref:Uncharacterized protein n=1 Tax=Sphingomonas lacunae TaxID=2698828 RepID=A0A6M4ASW8_9SPHN|nr:hypothetical protein [Sphingomonas lacunae]QJQ31806.1 hypothetical protein GV829_04555 [Sphingomonas lacunae]
MAHAHSTPQLRPLPGLALPQFTYSLSDIQVRLGQMDRSTRWLLSYVAKLIDGHGFPAPLPLQHGDTVDTMPRVKSRWPAAAVDYWFDVQLPQGGGTTARAERAAAEDLDARAAAIGLRTIKGGRS